MAPAHMQGCRGSAGRRCTTRRCSRCSSATTAATARSSRRARPRRGCSRSSRTAHARWRSGTHCGCACWPSAAPRNACSCSRTWCVTAPVFLLSLVSFSGVPPSLLGARIGCGVCIGLLHSTQDCLALWVGRIISGMWWD